MAMQLMMVFLTCTSIRHLKPVNLYQSDDPGLEAIEKEEEEGTVR